ncbi:cytochrome P450 [Fomitopsis serialis]|uniref:cytochrome P450 n=1 Tax=Fomitopsis serialis TaxID=139415 RepID=UPI0020083F88|nr:cytochrome P450 [Neoantrodia serialis]KAH9914219.1 cytochrome P450 [Neoantrodia serialis]
MATLRVAADATSANLFTFSAVASLTTCLYLHRFDVRGDVFLAYLLIVFASTASLLSHAGLGTFETLIQTAQAMGLYIGCMTAITVLYRISPFHPLAAFPGPLINKVTALKLAHIVWSGKRYLIIKDLHERYGSFVRTGPTTLSISSPNAIMPVYASPHSMDKSEAYRPGRFHPGGLFFIRERDDHNKRRRIWAPAFSAPAVEHMLSVVNKRTLQMLQCIERRRTKEGLLDMTEVIRHWAYDLMADITFGKASRIELMEDGDPHGVVASVQNATVLFETLGEIPPLFDVMWYLPVTKDVHVLDRISKNIMAERKNAPGQEDISAHLLGELGGERLSDEELDLDATFSIVAGSDTTAGSLTLLMFYLLRDQETYARLRAELDQHFSSPEEANDWKKLVELPYLFGVVHEGLRLGTPFPGLPRVVAKGGVVIDGKYVPEKTIVGVPPYVQQTSPENFYPNPMEFRPERWSPDGLGPSTVTKKNAIMCFSSGPFSCLGKTFAIREIHLVVAKLVLAFDMRLAPGFDEQAWMDGCLNMRTTLFKHPLMITATPRH